MNQTLKEMKVELNYSIPIMCDYTSAINISKISIIHSYTKHIPIKFHFLREKVTNNVVQLEYVATNEHLENIFTKILLQ